MNIAHNFGHVQNASIICRPGIYNLQTRTVTFPYQEKLLEKVDLRYLKTLKTKKLNTKNPQPSNKTLPAFKICEYVMIYRLDLYRLQTRKNS